MTNGSLKKLASIPLVFPTLISTEGGVSKKAEIRQNSKKVPLIKIEKLRCPKSKRLLQNAAAYRDHMVVFYIIFSQHSFNSMSGFN